MNTATAETGNIVIPCVSKAGQEAFAIFCRVVRRIYGEADAFIAAACPDTETVKTEHAEGTYRFLFWNCIRNICV